MRLLLATISLILLMVGAQAQWPVADLNSTIDMTNFFVNRGCSGTLIDAKQGIILTAAHCVSDQYEDVVVEDIASDGTVTMRKVRKLVDGTVRQLTFDGPEKVQTIIYRTRLVGSSTNIDLAVVKVVSPLPDNYRQAKIACSAPVRGEQIYIVGNPKGLLYSSVTTGVVSSVQRSYELFAEDLGDAKAPLMQISGGVVGGNSGGSVWNSRGELVGVPVVAYTINEVLGFAVPLESIHVFLKEKNLGYLLGHC